LGNDVECFSCYASKESDLVHDWLGPSSPPYSLLYHNVIGPLESDTVVRVCVRNIDPASQTYVVGVVVHLID